MVCHGPATDIGTTQLPLSAQTERAAETFACGAVEAGRVFDAAP